VSITQDEKLLKEAAELEKKGDEAVARVERESSYRRKLDAPWNSIVAVVSCAFVAYHIITARFGMPEAFKHRAIHLGFILFLLFIYYPMGNKSHPRRPGVIDIGLSILGAITCAYLYFNLDAFVMRAGVAQPMDYVFGAICIVLVLEACRRAVGPQLLTLVVILLLYAYFGRYVPGVLSHRGYSVERIIYQMYLTTQGIFGIPLGVSATYMVLFVVLAAMMAATGLGKLFNDLALYTAGRLTGGPAKVAVVASALLGTISGGAATNVATTGAFTIPLMKRMGYQPYFAGAVEAAASTGGQIMPPVMGTVAFVMADFLGVPYMKIAAAAAIPALLYFFGVFAQVDLRARALGLRGLTKEEIPDIRHTVRAYSHMLIPLVVLVYLLIQRYTAMYAAFTTLVLTYVLSLIRPETRLGPKRLLEMALNAGRSSLGVATAMANAGFVIGVLGMTGIGLIIADNIVLLSGGRLIIALVLTMIVAIILGMGLPTTACYVVAASICIPILTKMKVSPFQAHFFVLYFACLSTVTPPVALAAYVGAALAGAPADRVGWAALRLALAGFIVPFFFIYSPVMLLIAESPLQIVWSLTTGLIGTGMLAVAVEGFMWTRIPVWLRVSFFVAAVSLMDPGLLTDSIGLGLGAISLFVAYTLGKRQKSQGVARPA
jgi:TRAP transporter 4TM/12TM fusion protein